MAKSKDSAPIIYRDLQTGQTIRHVDVATADLPKEPARLRAVIEVNRKRLARVRDPHIIIRRTLFQLQAVTFDDITGLKPAELIQEIGRLNAVLASCHTEISRMKTSHPVVKLVTFELRFRQTSRKRDATRSWNSNTKRVYQDREEPETREDPTSDEG